MRLPIGYDNFRKILDNKLDFIDKTLFIKEVFDDKDAEAIVITRPRRFGKTLNLSFLHYFLSSSVYGQSTENLFDGLAITRCGGNYMQHQGKYPVISITFKDVKESNYSSALQMLAKLMSRTYFEHRDLLNSNQLTPPQKEAFTLILEGKANEASLKTALFDLTQVLYLHHNIKPWLLIDEYDTPIHAAYAAGYYDDMILFMRGCFGSALKNNPYFHKAVITGILRVAKESLFSGVNNLEVYSLLRNEYSQYFGFTENEVDDILVKSNLSEKAVDIKAWYNGYQFGNTTIYNPWSIANCVKRNGTLEPYWINTSDNQLIKDLLKKSPIEFKAQFEHLIQGNTIEKLIDENMAFGDLEKNSTAAWSLLLMSGYLTAVRCENTWSGKNCTVRVPNMEVNNLYRQIVSSWLSNGYGLEWYNQFTRALVSGDMEIFRSHLEKVLLQIVSCHDLATEPEAFFHGLLLGFIASLQESHEIKSNRESGLGRFDILIIPKDLAKYGIVMELKVKGEKATLTECAQQALRQIEQRKYTEEFKQRGIHNVIEIGIGFKGKEFALDYIIT